MLSFGFKAGVGGAAPVLPPVIPPTGKVPKVISSEIYANNSHRILVKWDTPMKGTTDVRFAINIIIDGKAPIVPNAVTFNGEWMTLSDNFKAGQVITWAYDDQNATEQLDTATGNVEADNQTYGVLNKLVATASAYDSAFSTAFK